jgi:hypothetical protein
MFKFYDTVFVGCGWGAGRARVGRGRGAGGALVGRGWGIGGAEEVIAD